MEGSFYTSRNYLLAAAVSKNLHGGAVFCSFLAKLSRSFAVLYCLRVVFKKLSF